MSITKPMLATAMKDPADIRYPLLASPKLDGIRCLIHPDHGPVSRKFKPIPNEYIREKLSYVNLHGLDGELVTYTNGKLDDFNTIQSKVMSVDGEPTFHFLVFDDFTDPDKAFAVRITRASVRCDDWLDYVQCVDHQVVNGETLLRELYAMWMAHGYEGAMTRDPTAPYKQGRSTLKQEWLLKLKAFADAEGTVIAFEEQLRNTNPAELDELGHTKRSRKGEGLVGKGTLGKLILETEWGLLSVGTGFDDNLRQEIWDNRDEYLGALVTFTYQPSGMQDKPRFPVFKGFRDRRDT